MKLNLSLIDLFFVILYYLLISFIGILVAKRSRKTKLEHELDFLFAGRKITLPFFVASLVATWYGNILGIGEFVHRYGLLSWFCFGIVYYISAFLYAIFLSKKIREIPSQTIPDLIGIKFGKTANLVASLIMLIVTFPSVYVLMVGIFINLIFGLDLLISITIGTIVTFIYIGYGGFKSNIITNSFQFILMYVGFGLFAFFSMRAISYDFGQLQKLPESHLEFFGNASWQYIISWVFISLQTFIDPSFFQRCFTVASGKTARNGLLISIFFWLVFDSMTIFVGLVGKLSYPNINPMLVYPTLLENIVPGIFKGLILVSMLATIVSTLESYTFLSSMIIGKNIFENFKFWLKVPIKDRIRIGLIITAFFSVLIAYLIPSAIDIIYKTSSIAVPALFYPTLLSFSKKKYLNKLQVNWIIISSSSVTLIFTFLKKISLGLTKTHFYDFIFSFEPMVFGFLWSTSLFAIMYFWNRNKLQRTTTTTQVLSL